MKKPFVVKGQPFVTPKQEAFNQTQETRIHILQALNGYLAINMTYESLKLIWFYFHWRKECHYFAFLSLGFLGLNIFWATTSVCGFKAVSKRSSRYISLFGYTVVANLILRVAMYIISGVLMTGYLRNYSIDAFERESFLCNAIYSQSLFILLGIVEGIVCVVVLILVRGAVPYIQTWENSDVTISRRNTIKCIELYDD